MKSSNLSVALLLEDLELAKEFSDIFRELGVVPHFYEDLDSFWSGTLEVIPTLCVVDVKKMHEGSKLLKDHPFVKSEEMLMAFYFKNSSAPLLHSTYDFYNMGTILHGANHRGQVKAVLKRLNKVLSYQQKIHASEIEKKKLNTQVRSLIEVSEVYKEDHFYDLYLKKMFNQFETQKNRATDFFEACENVFTELEDVIEFSYLELSANGQRLVSPESSSMKFVSIPSLFLGRTCKGGIEDFAQNMGSQVAVEMLGGEVMSINIKGQLSHPELIIYLKLSDVQLSEKFDWMTFENYLTGIYASFYENGKSVIKKEARFLTPWEAFSLFDKQIKMASVGEVKKQFALMDIDLSDLVSNIRVGECGDFAWKDFFQDFVARILKSVDCEIKLVTMGVNNIGVVCDYDYLDQVLSQLKNVAMRFSYWRYFEKSDAILSKSLKAEVKMIPASAEAYLLHVEDVQFSALDELENQAIKMKTKEIIWGKAPERTL